MSPFLVLWFFLVGTCARCDDDSVEFRLPEYNDLIWIPVTVGNAEHLCVLDSGCTYHVFHTSLRETLGKQLGEAAFAAADGAPVNAALYSVPDIKIGRITLRGSKTPEQDDGTGNVVLRGLRSVRRSPSLLIDALKGKDEECVACCDLALAQQSSGRNLEGFIGMPLFRATVVQLDFEHRRVTILPASTKPSSDWGQPIKISFNEKKLPTIDIELPDRVNAECTIDTGSDETISLSSELFAKLVDSQKIRRREDELVFQASGMKIIRVGQLASAKLGGFENALLRVREGGTQNRIGLKYLRRFFVTLDLGRKQIYLKKGAEFDAPDKEPAVSIGMSRKNDMTIVSFVGRNSPGERAGIQINDELVSVGGEAVRGKPHAEIRWMFREKADANGHVALGMRRDGVERNVDVEINR